MLIPHADFPVRPPMEKGESLGGYIYRFQGTNGHWVPPALHDALRVLYRGKYEEAHAAFELLQRVVGKETVLDREWWLGPPRSEDDDSDRIDWSPLNYGFPKFCPACLKAHGFHLALWDLPLIQACPVHEMALVEACPVCRRGFKWTDIAASWTCRCGQPICGIHPRSAIPWRINLAGLIANSSDVPLPAGYQNPSVHRELGTYCRKDLYDVLDWIKHLRWLLEEPIATPGEKKPKRRKGLRKSYPNAWQVKVLSDSTETLYRRVSRAVAHRFRGDKFILGCFSPDDGLLQGLMSIIDLPPCPIPVKEKLVSITSRFFASYRLELPIIPTVLFNPKITVAERTARLSAFADWWSALSGRMAPWDPNSQLPPRRDNGCVLLSAAMLDSQVFDVLQTLLGAAQKRLAIENFRALSHCWRVPEAAQNQTYPEDVLKELGSHLARLSWSELAFVCDLVNHGCRQGLRS